MPLCHRHSAHRSSAGSHLILSAGCDYEVLINELKSRRSFRLKSVKHGVGRTSFKMLVDLVRDDRKAVI